MADEKEHDHWNAMMAEYAPLIGDMARKLKRQGLPPHVDVEDLYSHGIHGLIDAFHKFKPNRGDFRTYASRRVEGKMRDHITSSGGIDNSFYKEANKWMKGQKDVSEQPSTPEQPKLPIDKPED